MSVWKSDETLLSICILNFSFKNDFVWEEISNIRHKGFITRWNTSKFVKNTPLRVVFSTLFSVFYLVMKHCVSCLIYYFSYSHFTIAVGSKVTRDTSFKDITTNMFTLIFGKLVSLSVSFPSPHTSSLWVKDNVCYSIYFSVSVLFLLSLERLI